MREPGNHDNGASDVGALTAYTLESQTSQAVRCRGCYPRNVVHAL